MALRVQTGLSQNKLAAKAEIARETYNKLETGNRPMSITYAAPLALALTELLGRKITATELLPPGSAGQPPEEDPYVLLGRLSATVEKHEKAIESQGRAIRSLRSRIRALEPPEEGGHSARGDN